jgi:hypothetical protein
MNQKKPWSVKYWRRCTEWHPQCSPRIVDADGDQVVEMPQFVDHPGDYDERADKMAQEIVQAVNAHDALLGACKECLIVVSDCYKSTGHIRVAQTSEQRLRIEKAIALGETVNSTETTV